ncbi:MAG: DNA polymerase Y family protein [Methylococcaceae bacterium]|nr:DNA polymerase Y family protein [Methylococcaceae bacterium]
MAATARAFSHPPSRRDEQALEPRSESRRLWLCAYFPNLALESLGLDPTQAVATLENIKGRPCLHAVSEPARLAGIESGMTLAAARALCPNLIIRIRDPEAEQLALQRLADAALDFSPWVSLDSPQCLLLEIGSCLSLFGGAESLREQLRQALLKLNHRPVIAITPAAEASELAALQGLESFITDKKALRSALGPLPIAALRLDEKTLRRLQKIGIRRLTDLWRLPRDGLARRYGKELLNRLDALAGQDNRAFNAFHRPPRFEARRDMPVELERLEHFFPAVEQLAEEFEAFLQARDATALGVNLEIIHHARPSTRLELNFRTGSRDAGHWLALLHEKLERSPLPAPVLALALFSQAIAPFQPEVVTLFDDDAAQINGDREWQSMLDQLQARLGTSALKQLSILDDHRPERAMTAQPVSPTQNREMPARPLWLLSKPEALDIQGLQLLSETERIESGWWDNAPIRRDYRVALDRRGRKLWVFRDLNANGSWYLHGLFG